MVQNFQSLSAFVDIAVKNRAYPVNTVYGLRASMKLFLQELKDEERNSLDLIKQRFDKIYQSVYQKNISRISPASLEIYKRRLRGLINDYEQYGQDPAKMAAWVSKPRPVRTRKETKVTTNSNITENVVTGLSSIQSGDVLRIEVPLKGKKATLLLPPELSKVEGEKIKKMIDAYVNE